MANMLLPCPHCGNTDHLYPTHRLFGDEKPYAIDCVRCGYDFTPRDGLDVVELWNRRFDPTDLTAIAELQRRETDARLSNEVNTSILKGVMEQLGIEDDLKIEETVVAITAQIDWLKGRLSDLQLPANSPKNIEEWLVECGMPTLPEYKGVR